MQYAILAYQPAESFGVVPTLDPTLHQAFAAFMDAIRSAGVFVFATIFEHPESSTTLRFDGDEHFVQDGPYGDTKEQIASVLVVSVPSLDAAMDWVARIPRIPGRIYEVRPITAYHG